MTALLGRIGLAAICVSRDGLLLSSNPAADQVLSGGAIDGRAVARRARDQVTVDPKFLSKMESGDRVFSLLSDRDAVGLRTIVQAFALDPGLIEQDAFLILFRDPAGREPVDPTAVLELLGLTPAEARLAAMWGLEIPSRPRPSGWASRQIRRVPR